MSRLLFGFLIALFLNIGTGNELFPQFVSLRA
jgi:hypothetical protein